MRMLWFAAIALLAALSAATWVDVAMPGLSEGGRQYVWLSAAVGISLVSCPAVWLALRSARQARHKASAQVLRLEEALRLAGAHQRLFAENVQDCALVPLDLDGRVTSWNEGAERLTGYQEAQIVGQLFCRFYPGQDTQPGSVLKLAAAQGRLHEEGWSVRQDGSRFRVRVVVTACRDASGELRGFLWIAQDITKRKLMEGRLRRARQECRSLAETTRDLIFTISPEGTFSSLNLAFEKSTDWPRAEWLGRRYLELVHLEDAAAAARFLNSALQGEPQDSVELRIRTRSGNYLVMELTAAAQARGGKAQDVFVIAHDLTDCKEMERALRQTEDQAHQAQKMEVIGRLAGGVAHDFNNILTVIFGCCEMLSKQPGQSNEARKLLGEIHRASERASALTGQLLALSRKKAHAPRQVNLNALLKEMYQMVRRLIGESSELVTALAPDLAMVRADPAQLEQVLLNLFINARDAMSNGGRLTLETGNIQLDVKYAREHPEVRPGSYVMVAVSDTGCGMSDEIKAHLFEPFFTTKDQGKGTGLGLATAYGIVKQLGGHIEVQSALGTGATFKIYLPRDQQTAAVQSSHSVPRGAAQGNETVLLAEDDSNVRAVARCALQANGYTVLEAGCGHEALTLSQNHEGSIRILVTDVLMPDVTGCALATRLLRLRPDMQVLYMSGHSDSFLGQQGLDKSCDNFLGKPFTPEALAYKVRDVLDRKTQTPSAMRDIVNPVRHDHRSGGH